MPFASDRGPCRTPLLILFVLGAAMALSGCKNKGKPVGNAPEDVRGDVRSDQRADDGRVEPGDVKTLDERGEDADVGFIEDVPGDETGGTDWTPKSCQSHDDCEGIGMCVEVSPGSGKYVCAPYCMQECPGGWECKSINVGGPDPVSLCFPPTETICSVCTKDEECLFFGALCVKGSGSVGFCGKYCHPEDSPECPESFACAMAKGKNGENLGYQCLPPDGSCCIAGKMKSCDDKNPCSADLCDPSLGCKHKNIDGPCVGPDQCTEYKCVNGGCMGFPVTTDKTKDGVDDDCDGLTDEDWAYGLQVPVHSFSGTVHTVKGTSYTVRGSLSAPPAAGASSGGDFKVTPGMVKAGGE